MQEVPYRIVSRFIYRDPEIQIFLVENEGKILALMKWAAREITKEPMDRETMLAALCVNASAKIDMEWFDLVNHQKKDQLKDIVMLNIQGTGIGILDNDPFTVGEFLGPEQGQVHFRCIIWIKPATLIIFVGSQYPSQVTFGCLVCPCLHSWRIHHFLNTLVDSLPDSLPRLPSPKITYPISKCIEICLTNPDRLFWSKAKKFSSNFRILAQ